MKSMKLCHRLLLILTQKNHKTPQYLPSIHQSLPTKTLPNLLPRRYFSQPPFSTPEPSNNNTVRRCWNCNSNPTSNLFLVCDSCRSIQPPNPHHHYFLLFGLEKKFDIEEGSLEGKYKDWQKKLHPDLVHSKSQREREYAADQSSRVIDAYRTLSDPLSRAIYLMKLYGVHVDEEQTVSDPDLLAEIMELRESVEDAASSQELNQIHAQVHEKMKEWTESFARAFKSQDIGDALNAIRRITYYKRASEEIVKRL